MDGASVETDGQVLTVAGPRYGGDAVFIATRLAQPLDRTSCRVPQVHGIAESDGQGASGTAVKAGGDGSPPAYRAHPKFSPGRSRWNRSHRAACRLQRCFVSKARCCGRSYRAFRTGLCPRRRRYWNDGTVWTKQG